MRKLCQFLSALFVFLFITSLANAQNDLAAGDIGIVSYQSDLDLTSPPFEDRFSIVILKPGGITAGTVIYFTDRGWDGPNSTWLDNVTVGHEAVVKWVVPVGGIVFGTEVYFISSFNAGINTWGAYTTESGTTLLGTVTSETNPLVDGGMGFTVSGDELLVYQTGPVAGPAGAYNATPIRFITALLANLVSNSTTSAGWDAIPVTLNESSLPPGLTTGINAFVMTPASLPNATVDGTTEPDNGKYNCTNSVVCNGSSLTTATIYTAANWNFSPNAFTVGLTSNHCTYAAAAPITINAPTVTQPTCTVNTGTIVVNATGTGTLEYQLNAGAFQLSNTFNPLTPGNYNISVRSQIAPACVTTYSGNPVVINSAIPTFAATYVKTNLSVCSGAQDGTITVTPTGGTAPYTYSWTGESGSNHTPFTAGNVSSLTGLNYGFYNVTITDAGGCGVVTLTNIHVEFAYAVYVTNSGSASGSCGNTGSVLLYGNAGVTPYTFALSTGSGAPTPAPGAFQASNSFTGLAAGPYTGFIKDASGCVSSKNIAVGTIAAVVANPFAVGSSSCNADGTIQVFKSGGVGPYTYSLNGGTYQASNFFSGLAAGPYTANVKDANGCIGSAPVTVNQGVGLTVTASKVNTSICVTDGSIQVNASGGVAPYSYSINGGLYQASNSFSGLGASTYVISVKDAKNCTGSLNVIINLNSIVVTAFATAATSCLSNNGQIQLFRTGGTGPYTYSRDGNTYQASTIFLNLTPGTYNGYVKDTKGCVGVLNGIVVGPNCPAPPTAANSKNGTYVEPVKALAALKVNVYPNPGNAAFTLQLDCYNSKEKVSVKVTDLLGKIVYQIEGTGKQQLRFGSNFLNGIYNVQVIQGTDLKNLKLIKE